ncbi:hypothetical protein [Rouxiella sp. WC2420]|uniref:Uncharacterized protein n=1 Tax=Rouxiella sp. WC2420 TaxID=3234145 RepID=A0AB39VLG8_9GAMM
MKIFFSPTLNGTMATLSQNVVKLIGFLSSISLVYNNAQVILKSNNAVSSSGVNNATMQEEILYHNCHKLKTPSLLAPINLTILEEKLIQNLFPRIKEIHNDMKPYCNSMSGRRLPEVYLENRSEIKKLETEVSTLVNQLTSSNRNIFALQEQISSNLDKVTKFSECNIRIASINELVKKENININQLINRINNTYCLSRIQRNLITNRMRTLLLNQNLLPDGLHTIEEKISTLNNIKAIITSEIQLKRINNERKTKEKIMNYSKAMYGAGYSHNINAEDVCTELNGKDLKYRGMDNNFDK